MLVIVVIVTIVEVIEEAITENWKAQGMELLEINTLIVSHT